MIVFSPGYHVATNRREGFVNTETRLRMPLMALMGMVLAVVFALTAGAGTAMADGQEISMDNLKAKSTQKLFYFPGSANEYVNDWWVVGSKKVTNVKSSNKKVVAVKTFSSKKNFQMTLKKAGKANVTFKYKGKKYTMKVVVAKYTNPFTKFTIGSKNYAKKFKSQSYFSTEKSISGKMAVKASSAWKFLGFYGYGNTGLEKLKTKTFPKENGFAMAKMKHKKTGAILYCSVISF